MVYGFVCVCVCIDVYHNIFSCYRSDWLLKFLYRTLSMASDVAGLQPIDVQDRRMCNIDLSDIVSGE